AATGAMTVPATLLLARRERVIDNEGTSQVVGRLTGGAAVTVEFNAAHVLEFEADPAPFHAALRRAVQGSE
ncbi:MAG: hypothetical protein LLG01_06835, partial [Planctomycetaceae bacterium]|nr:hypothetical protein [Planctomycetaceae bacterium]